MDQILRTFIVLSLLSGALRKLFKICYQEPVLRALIILSLLKVPNNLYCLMSLIKNTKKLYCPTPFFCNPKNLYCFIPLIWSPKNLFFVAFLSGIKQFYCLIDCLISLICYHRNLYLCFWSPNTSIVLSLYWSPKKPRLLNLKHQLLYLSYLELVLSLLPGYIRTSIVLSLLS